MPFAALSASYFAHIGFFNPYLPLWLKDLGFSLVVISLLASAQAFTRLFAPYGWGLLSDSTGERVLLLRWGAVGALLASAGLWFELGPWAMLAVLLIMFGHTSAMMPMTEAAMAQWVSSSGTFDTRRYGRVRLWGSLGFLLTVLSAGAWFEHFGLRHFPLWTSVSLLALVCSVCLVPNLKEPRTPLQARAGLASVGPVLRQREVRWFFAALFFHVLSHMGIYVFFSLYLDALGYSKTTIGLLWALSVVAEIAWFYTQGRWLPRLSASAWLVLCAATMLARMLLTASVADSLVWLVLAQVLHALTFATHHTVCISCIAGYFPGGLRGRGQALFTVVGYGLTGVLGGVLGGLASQAWGLRSVFWLCVAVSALACLCAWQVWRQSMQHAAPSAV